MPIHESSIFLNRANLSKIMRVNLLLSVTVRTAISDSLRIDALKLFIYSFYLVLYKFQLELRLPDD